MAGIKKMLLGGGAFLSGQDWAMFFFLNLALQKLNNEGPRVPHFSISTKETGVDKQKGGGHPEVANFEYGL